MKEIKRGCHKCDGDMYRAGQINDEIYYTCKKCNFQWKVPQAGDPGPQALLDLFQYTKRDE